VTQGVHAQTLEIAEVQPKSGGPGKGLLQEGQKVSFRVLDALPQDRYLISAKHHRFVVTSRIPLTVGTRYAAEVSLRGGRTLLLYQTTRQGLLDLISSHRGGAQRPLASVLQNLPLAGSLPSSLTTGMHTSEAVRSAILHCGLFYEARLRKWVEGKEPFQPLQDLKGFLLAQLRDAGSVSLRETIAAALKQLETLQVFTLQAGMEGALPFCLPFGDQKFIEGFLKRAWSSSGSNLIVALRVPFVDSEELLVIISWKPREVDVCFSPGEAAAPLLREAAHEFEEQLGAMGLTRISVRVSNRIPRHMRQGLRGSGFLDSYG
jgi:hypothetical protein